MQVMSSERGGHVERQHWQKVEKWMGLEEMEIAQGSL